MNFAREEGRNTGCLFDVLEESGGTGLRVSQEPRDPPQVINFDPAFKVSQSQTSDLDCLNEVIICHFGTSVAPYEGLGYGLSLFDNRGRGVRC